jgi:hypothetical protein
MKLRFSTEDPLDWVKLRFPFLDKREVFNVTIADTLCQKIDNEPIGDSDAHCNYQFQNETIRQFDLLVKGYPKVAPRYFNDTDVKAIRCWGEHCEPEELPVGPVETDTVLVWSLHIEGSEKHESVTTPACDLQKCVIKPNWKVILDSTHGGVYELIEINGIVEFKSTASVRLNAKNVHVRSG